ncbi:uncharacterized protein LOC116237009 isoform X2 [Phasianus colchicus]|uniref:uncharacterized protein LOC116237009 isoform X2 n=1 Tax=Phasianus colchicus TaxID=9054 RepID=UPI00129D9B3E|nr:uncharacterized protein LOC116237009 isoform X2 [Phasianus colchicus]
MEQVIKSLFAIIKDWLSDTNGEYSRKVWLLGKPKKEMETKPRRQTKSKSGKPGELTLLSPNFTTWMQYGPNVTSHRVKRSSPVPESCNDEVELWSATAQIFASFFAPGVAAAQSLAQIERLACWSAKQANLTTLVLNAMLEDTNSIRHAMLQDRAAIDFLLLAQGHGCEDLEGMCCFNLSDHSVSIHKALKALQDHSN